MGVVNEEQDSLRGLLFCLNLRLEGDMNEIITRKEK